MAWLLIPTTWKLATKSSFEEFHAPIWQASLHVRDLSYFWGHLSDSKKTLIEKGRDHQRILSDLNNQLNTTEDLNKEIQNLRNLKLQIQELENSLSLEAQIKFYPELSRISLRNLSGWNQEFKISKGSQNKLKTGSGVISHCGIVGFVQEVYENSANIKLISNKNFRMVAHLKGDKRPVTFRGNGISASGALQGYLYDIPADVKIPENEQIEVVSSNLGGKFPNGLHIGFLSKLEPSSDGVFKTSKVLLSSSLNQISEVTILRRNNAN